jgi:predicted AAA+ superfamily ATPase
LAKAVFLQQIKQFLLKDKISEERIIIIEKESLEFDFINNYKDLHTYIQKKRVSEKSEKHYIFIDEI